MMSALLGMTKSELVTLLSPTGQQLTKKTANETGAVRCSLLCTRKEEQEEEVAPSGSQQGCKDVPRL